MQIDDRIFAKRGKIEDWEATGTTVVGRMGMSNDDDRYIICVEP